MPLPAPLRKGASRRARRKRFGEVMHDLKHGPHHGERTRAQEEAVAFKYSDEGRKSKRKVKRKARRRARRARR